MPALASVRAQARAVKCMSNIRQLGIALRLYASDNKDYYPINVSKPVAKIADTITYWNDADRIGRYLAIPTTPMDSSSPFWCPEDDGPQLVPPNNGSQQSYAMNVLGKQLG